MSVPIEVAAHLVGRNHPTSAAAELRSVRTQALRALAEPARRTAGAIAVGADGVDVAIGTVAAAWSNPAPCRTLHALRQASDDARAIMVGQASAVEEAAATIEGLQAQVASEVAAGQRELDLLLSACAPEVTATIAQEQVLLQPNMTIATQHIVDGVRARIEGLTRSARGVLADLCRELAPSPTDPVRPLALGPGVLPQGDALAALVGAHGARATDAANRRGLARDLTSRDPATRRMAEGVTRALGQAAASGGAGELLVYAPASLGSQGRAAISVGDVVTARHVSVIVPGITNSPTGIAEAIPDAAALTRAVRQEVDGAPAAAVLWFGYDIPLSWWQDGTVDPAIDLSDTFAATDAHNARAGGELLATDTHALAAMLRPDADITLIGFSMGATTVSEAARLPLPVRNLVLLGSPGAGWDAHTAADYASIPPERVFVASYDEDPVTGSGIDVLAWVAHAARYGPALRSPFGPDPAAAGFGAQRIAATARIPLTLPASPFVLAPRARLSEHSRSNYLTEGSGPAVAAVVAGRYDRVPIQPGR